MDNYKYDAFISYRHITPDKPIAERLQKLLESYIPPKGIGADKSKLHLFRDETELPTSDNLGKSIRDALERSRYLIVVCSPETEKSRWCMEEIEYFKSLHGGKNDNILTLLCSPDDTVVFPESLRFENVTVTDESGEHEERREVEPLAANVSAPALAQSQKKLKTEYLRLAASLLGCTYDDLYGREQRRKNRRRLITAVTVAAVLAVISLVSISALVTISSQKSRIENDARELRIKQANILAKESAELEKNGDLYGAMQSALNALDNSDDESVPLQNAALYQAAKLSGAYETEIFTAVRRIDQKSKITDFVLLDGGKKLFTTDGTDGYLWNTETGKLVKSYDNADSFVTYRDPSLDSGTLVDTRPGAVAYNLRGNTLYNYNINFIPDGKRVADNAVYFMDYDTRSVCRLDPEDGGKLWEYSSDEYIYSISDVTADGVAVSLDKSAVVLSPKDGSLIASVTTEELEKHSGNSLNSFYYSGGYLAVYYHDFQRDGKYFLDLYKRDGKDFKFQWSKNVSGETVFREKLLIRGDRLYYAGEFISMSVFSETQLTCMSLADGSELWSVKPGDKFSGENIYVGFMPAGKAKDYDIAISAVGNQFLLVNDESGKLIARELLPGDVTQMRIDEQKIVFLTLSDGTEIFISLSSLIDGEDETSRFFVRDFRCEPDKTDSCNGVYAVVEENSPSVTIYRTVKNSGVKTLLKTDGEKRYTGFVFSPDKKKAAISTRNPSELAIADISGGKIKQTGRIPKSIFTGDCFFLGSDAICTVDYGSIKLYDAATGEQIREYGSDYNCSGAVFCSKAGVIYFSGKDGRLYLDDGRESKPVFDAAKSGFEEIDNVYASPDASRYVLCLRDSDFNYTLCAFDSDGNNTELVTGEDFSSTGIKSFCWSPDNAEFRILNNGEVEFYDLETGKKTAAFEYGSDINDIIDIDGSLCLIDIEGNLVKTAAANGEAAEKARLSLGSGNTQTNYRYTSIDESCGVLIDPTGDSWLIDTEKFELTAAISHLADVDIEQRQIVTCAFGNLYSFPLLTPEQLRDFSSKLIA